MDITLTCDIVSLDVYKYLHGGENRMVKIERINWKIGKIEPI